MTHDTRLLLGALFAWLAMILTPVLASTSDAPIPRRNPLRAVVSVEPMPVADTPAAQCPSINDIAEFLTGRFNERPVGMGDVSGGRVVLWVAEGTWTLTVSDESGMTCIMAAGKNWRGKVAGRGA